MTYLDITFCVSPNCTNKCGRKLTPEIRAAAIKDWGGEDAPISVGHFCNQDGEANAGSFSEVCAEEELL